MVLWKHLTVAEMYKQTIKDWLQSGKTTEIQTVQMSQCFVPDSIFSCRIPFQRDRKSNHICYGKLTNFESRRENSALWKQKYIQWICSWSNQSSTRSLKMLVCSSEHRKQNMDWPEGHILWQQPHLRSASCSFPSQRICWFSPWWLAF